MQRSSPRCACAAGDGRPHSVLPSLAIGACRAWVRTDGTTRCGVIEDGRGCLAAHAGLRSLVLGCCRNEAGLDSLRRAGPLHAIPCLARRSWSDEVGKLSMAGTYNVESRHPAPGRG